MKYYFQNPLQLLEQKVIIVRDFGLNDLWAVKSIGVLLNISFLGYQDRYQKLTERIFSVVW